MSDPKQYATDYPYAPRPAPPSDNDYPIATSWIWPTVWRWTRRAAVTAALLLLLLTIVGGYATFRGAWRGWLVYTLERHGATVGYYDPAPNAQDWYPEFLSERLGDWWWSDVREVFALENWRSLWSATEYSKEDVSTICAACSSLPRLRRFTIRSNDFSCSQIEDWPHLAELEEFSVESVLLADSDLAIIGKMRGLKALSLTSGRFSNTAISHLASLPSLERLELRDVQFTVSNSEPSNGFGALQILNVWDSPKLSDEVLACFGSPPQLERINFFATPLGDAGIARLLKHDKLKSCVIHQGNVTDAGLVFLAAHPPKESLALADMPLTDRCLEAFSGKQLPSLSLERTQVTDEAFQTFNTIVGLEHLSLADTKVTGIGIRHWKQSVPLAHLDLSGIALTPAGIAALAEANCSELLLARTKLSDEQLKLFANNDSLLSLDVTATLLTAEGVQAFYQARKKRLGATGGIESLMLNCDYPDVVASILGIDTMGGLPVLPDFSEGYANEGD